MSSASFRNTVAPAFVGADTHFHPSPMGADLLEYFLTVRNDNDFVKQTCCHRVVIGMAYHGLLPQHLHQFSRETGGGISGRDHSDYLHR